MPLDPPSSGQQLRPGWQNGPKIPHDSPTPTPQAPHWLDDVQQSPAVHCDSLGFVASQGAPSAPTHRCPALHDRPPEQSVAVAHGAPASPFERVHVPPTQTYDWPIAAAQPVCEVHANPGRLRHFLSVALHEPLVHWWSSLHSVWSARLPST